MSSLNPYEPSLHPVESPKTLGRFLFVLDLIGIAFATLPLVILAFLVFVVRDFKNIEPMLSEHPLFFLVVFLSIIGLFAGSGIYNLVETINGRRTALIGLLLGILTVAAWIIEHYVN